MASRELGDATPTLAAKYEEIDRLFEANCPTWRLDLRQTLRSDAEQLAAFLGGFSQLDPRVPANRLSAKHLAGPDGKSRAIDCEIVNRATGMSADKMLAGKRITRDHYLALYTILMLLVNAQGLRSGNDWNRNNVSVEPDPKEGFFDAGHIEI